MRSRRHPRRVPGHKDKYAGLQRVAESTDYDDIPVTPAQAPVPVIEPVAFPEHALHWNLKRRLMPEPENHATIKALQQALDGLTDRPFFAPDTHTLKCDLLSKSMAARVLGVGTTAMQAAHQAIHHRINHDLAQKPVTITEPQYRSLVSSGRDRRLQVYLTGDDMPRDELKAIFEGVNSVSDKRTSPPHIMGIRIASVVLGGADSHAYTELIASHAPAPFTLGPLETPGGFPPITSPVQAAPQAP